MQTAVLMPLLRLNNPENKIMKKYESANKQRGRPAKIWGGTVVRLHVLLDTALHNTATDIGNGNASLGIRKALSHCMKNIEELKNSDK